ncbi:MULTISPECIES: TIGR04086 family membrane protein [Paenibacillus]|uniref:TIGR04086 family membrane protein n=1 Tax=Paenibacillus TaxID=44249 RepID=UPI000BBDDDDE|nr:TIGR04086 family membrane protein [Paenibacillus lautus]PCL94128.1 TIGR04086 family membrane protein [Paenibacillus lautus]
MEPIRRVFTFRITNPILSGLLYSYFWMFLGALALSLLLWGSGLAEDDLSFYTFLVHAVAAFIGGCVSGKRAGNKGWYYGCLTGLVYGITLLAIGFLALDSSLSLGDLTLIATVFAAGAIGGMFGVNLKK